ncbi:hypothetical protein [Phytopseudomonas dryadis]|uniref:Uncharacterized protein n=1 Tax=Phytopseudomonas dryadis TaxID=2487520 RepID=A0ABY1Z489_9GAMM|nr:MULTISPECIES: hypothetical protein [Pseudomonas]TBV02798.1 hypothetical protein DNK34_17740 [Pseudomonas dryadis]TBV15956.1 hypothetical protein DNK41_17035 [Pseudomonas sp. FRB 230]
MSYHLLCAELTRVLAAELNHGNSLTQQPQRTDWPQPGSLFAALRHDFRSDTRHLPDSLRHGYCNDPHYGWYEELYCSEHHHLLVAGRPRPGKR